MPRISKKGYVERIAQGESGSHRDWWTVKAVVDRISPQIVLNSITLPPELIGKKVRFKLEVIEDD